MVKGFSLVELSIVLVILGLLTGGILGGRSLIRAAEIRRTISDFQKLQTASHTFRVKYLAIPGDFKNATAFFDATGIMNGDGNGKIQYQPTAAINEVAEFLRHLSVANLIPGEYGGAAYLPGLPQTMTSASGASYEIAWRSLPYGGREEHVFFIGTRLPDDSGWEGAFSPEEGLQIDIKLDDGVPSKGTVRAETIGGVAYTQCVTTDPGGGPSDGLYVTAIESKTCILMVRSGL